MKVYTISDLENLKQEDKPKASPNYTKVPLGQLNVSFPIYYENRQWALTNYGIECLVCKYAIDKSWLTESDWVYHMAEKGWVDLDEFLDVFFRAYKNFEIDVPFNADDFYFLYKRVKKLRGENYS